MPIATDCPHCRTRIHYESDRAGLFDTCPRCRQLIQLPSLPAKEPHWFLGRNKQKLGPFAYTQLVQMAKANMLQQSDMLLEEGKQRWCRATEVNGLFPVVAPPGGTAAVPLPTAMISCSTCRRSIGSNANACPHCGTPNTWCHPEIARFLNSINDFRGPSRIRFDNSHYWLTGCGLKKTDKGKRAAADQMASGCFIAALGTLCFFFAVYSGLRYLVVVGCLSVLVALYHFVGAFFSASVSTKTEVSFLLDFSKSPPEWTCTDENYWKDVKKFFHLDAPR